LDLGETLFVEALGFTVASGEPRTLTFDLDAQGSQGEPSSGEIRCVPYPGNG
jgi:hypothetical protein